jgi:hypothetical protein
MAQATPSIPVEITKKLYTLYYRRGTNPHSMMKNFEMSGTLREVVERTKKHCENLGCRFVRVEPFLSDLSNDERLHMGLGAGAENAD